MWERFRRATIRLWRLWRIVPFADKVNAFVGLGSLLIGGMAVVLTVIALRMAERQETIAARQAEIAEMQFKILQKQLALDARLIVVSEGWEKGNGVKWFVKNRGFGPKTVHAVIVWAQHTQTLGLFCKGVGDDGMVETVVQGQYTKIGITRRVEIPAETSVLFASCDASPIDGRSGTLGFPFTWDIFAENENFKSTDPDYFLISILSGKTR